MESRFRCINKLVTCMLFRPERCFVVIVATAILRRNIMYRPETYCMHQVDDAGSDSDDDERRLLFCTTIRIWYNFGSSRCCTFTITATNEQTTPEVDLNRKCWLTVFTAKRSVKEKIYVTL